MAESVVSFVVENICNLLKENPQILNGVISDHIQQLVDKFRSIQPFLKHADARQKQGQISTWIADLRKLVYDAEDVIESYILKALSISDNGSISIRRYVCALDGCLYRHKTVHDIKAIQKRMDELTTRLRGYNMKTTAELAEASATYDEVPGKLKRFYSHVIGEPQVVGLEKDVETLVAHLVDQSEDSYQVVSICGMGGLGKTTLARKIYTHSAIVTHFEALAWVSISQNLQLRNVLQRIILCLVKDEHERNRIMNLEDIKLLEHLCEIQESRKCLVVVDDIWTNDAWDALKPAFPTQGAKSKLILTSRNVLVSEHIDTKAFLHRPQLLNDEQSWDLLRMRALPKPEFLNARDVKDMEEFGREMVRYCGGLPLSIVVLGGILVTKPSWIEWKNVHQEIQSSIGNGEGMGEAHQTEVLRILALSYNDLPYQLRPCFLYLARFGEDTEITAETLYQLWIAEGFVLSSDRRVEGESLMDVAESYLAELVHKCLVGVKVEEKEPRLRMFGSCELHDLMRDLALSKAKEEDFFNVLYIGEDNTCNHHEDLQFVGSTYTRRLDIYYDDDDVVSSKDIRMVKDASKRLRSVLWFNDGMNWSMKDSAPILRLKLVNFSFLRVLSFEGFLIHYEDIDFSYEDMRVVLCRARYVMMNRLSDVVGSLIFLRYLSLRNTGMLFFPSFVEKLTQLQTLDLRVDGDFMIRLPWARRNVMRKMGQLRHLYLPDVKIKNLGKTNSNSNRLRLDGLSNLETLENLDAKWCQLQDLHKLKNLRKLTMKATGVEWESLIIYLESKACSCIRYTSLEIIFYPDYIGRNDTCTWKRLFGCNGLKLDRLDLWGNIGGLPAGLDINATLSDLCIYGTYFEKDPMPILEKLPALRELFLGRNSYNGKEIVCSATGFRQLKVLKLYRMCNLEKWKMEQRSMPNLSDLHINRCVKLQDLPVGLKYITSLKSLIIGNMPSEFCDRLRSGGPEFYKVAHVPYVVFNTSPLPLGM